jgi:hypothetical protein
MSRRRWASASPSTIQLPLWTMRTLVKRRWSSSVRMGEHTRPTREVRWPRRAWLLHIQLTRRFSSAIRSGSWRTRTRPLPQISQQTRFAFTPGRSPRRVAERNAYRGGSPWRARFPGRGVKARGLSRQNLPPLSSPAAAIRGRRDDAGQ